MYFDLKGTSDKVKLIMTRDSEQGQSPEAFERGIQNYANWQEMVEQLVAMRGRKGITQREMAKRLGITQPAVAQFELSSANPTMTSLMRYVNALDAQIKFTVLA